MGWSLPRFQRHQKEHIKQRAKEMLENLEKLIDSGKTEYLFAVAEEGIEAEFKNQLSTGMEKKLVLLPSVEPHDPDHKILGASIATLQTISRQKAEAMARHILEEAEPLGQATAGPEPTLSALQGHQVERIVLDARFKATGWRCPQCGSLGSGGLPTACPYCQGQIGSANLREEITTKAKSQGVELFFTENFSTLMKAGGIGALLKYKTSKRMKR
jgi:rubrerythrin